MTNLDKLRLALFSALFGMYLGYFIADYKADKKLEEKKVHYVTSISTLSCLITTQQFIDLRLGNRKDLSCEEVENEIKEVFLK